MKKTSNSLKKRCPALGSVVPFGYCEKCGTEELPCAKVFDCWWEVFDIELYMKDTLPKDRFDKLVNYKPKTKISGILECVIN